MRDGLSFVRAAWTPVASEVAWYVVQLEPNPEDLGEAEDLAAPVVALADVVAAERAVDERLADEPQPKQHSDTAVTATAQHEYLTAR